MKTILPLALCAGLAFLVMPDQKVAGSFACLVLGGVLSWILIGKTFWPDYSAQTRLPIYITWAGGALGFLGIVLLERKRRRPSQPVQAMGAPAPEQCVGERKKNGKILGIRNP